MTLKNLVVIVYIIIVLLLLFLQIHNNKWKDRTSTIIILILAAIISVFAFAIPWALPDEIANTKIEYLDGHITISQPAQSDESTLTIESFQITGDSTKGIAHVKFHLSSNFYLLNGSITIFPGRDLEPITVGYNIPSATCLSATSGTNFGISFKDMISGETYTAQITAEDISGNKISETIEFVAF